MLIEGNCTTNLIKARFGDVGVTRRIRSLREEGYVIEMTPLLRNNYSYRLVSVPEKPVAKAKKKMPVAASERVPRAIAKAKVQVVVAPVIESCVVAREPILRVPVTEYPPGSIEWCEERRRICQQFAWY
jgi:hypothetical protein